jgi:hypothetical protein
VNIRMRVCYLGSHEAGLCCYLVIHIENLLHQLQLFYFHFLPIYWLSLLFHYFLIMSSHVDPLLCNDSVNTFSRQRIRR